MSAPELFNWVVEVDRGPVSITLWIEGCPDIEDGQPAKDKALEQVEVFLAAVGLVSVNGLPVNMGAD